MDEMTPAAKTQQIKWFERDFTLEDAMELIRSNMVTAVRSYVAVGFYLKAIRDRKLFEEAGFQNFEEFVRERLDRDKTWASRCMKVNDQLSENGNSPVLDEAYRQYSVSQLVELSYMTEEQRSRTEPEMTVAQMREMRKPREIPYFDLPGQLEMEKDFGEIFQGMEEADAVPAVETFMADAAELFGETEGEQLKQTERTPGGEVAISQQPEPEAEALHFKSGDRTIDGAYGATISRIVRAYLDSGYARPEKECEVTALGWTYKVLKRGDVTAFCTEAGQAIFDVENARLEEEFQYWHGSKEAPESEAVIEGEFTEIPASEQAKGVTDGEAAEVVGQEESLTDLQIARKELERANNLLTRCLEDLPDENNVHIRGMKLKVAALASFVCDMDMIENPPPKPEQPTMPILRNNDQRKEWLENFRSWPVWFEVPEASEVYYRYDLPDGSSFVICEYQYWADWVERYGYDESPDRTGEREYLLKPGYHYLHDCLSNRTTLIEKLKEIQKKG